MLAEFLTAAIPVWAHIALLWGAFVLLAWREWRHELTDRALRQRLGACRSSLAATEIQRDLHRREAQSRHVRLEAQERELVRYRRLAPPDMRLTQVMPDPTEPEGAA